MGQNLAKMAFLDSLHEQDRRDYPDKLRMQLNVHKRLKISEWITTSIDPWCEYNLKGKFAIFGKYQYFELEEDAVLFILRWC